MDYASETKKAYIAARFAKKGAVQEVQKLLAEHGYTVISDWTSHPFIKPYKQNLALAKKYSEEAFAGIKKCDLFILISDAAGTGMYVEFGAAIASCQSSGKPHVYVIGDHTDRSMFYFHPLVKIRKNIGEVLREI